MIRRTVAFGFVFLFALSAHRAIAAPVLLSLPGLTGPGDSFEIRFRFDAPPINPDGDANVLVINGGSNNLGLLFSWVDLYADDTLLSTYQGMTNSFGVFTEGNAIFSVWANRTDLAPIWGGAEGRIVFRPVFEEGFENPFVNYQINWLYASRDTGAATHDDTYTDPIILGTQVNTSPVPEPATLSLFAAGCGTLWMSRRRRRSPDANRIG